MFYRNKLTSETFLGKFQTPMTDDAFDCTL